MASGEEQDWLRLLNKTFSRPTGALEDVLGHVRKRIRERKRGRDGADVDGEDLQDWFLECCTYQNPAGRTVDYSHRRRQALAKAFNRVAGAAIEAGLLPEGVKVRNHQRRKRPLVCDREVLLDYPLSGFLRLSRSFVERVLSQGQVECHDDPAWDAYFGAVFALIAMGGICWKGAFASTARLRACHLAHLGRDVLLVPRPRTSSAPRVVVREHETVASARQARERRGGEGRHFVLVEEDDGATTVETKAWVRVHLHPFVALCVASAACCRARPDVDSTRRSLAPLHPGSDLLPDRRGERGLREGRFPLARTRQRFNRWLGRLCEQAGQPILTVSTLARLARTYLWLDDVYPEPVLAALLGRIPYHPVPLDELGIFETYSRPLEPPPWPEQIDEAPSPLDAGRASASQRSPDVTHPEAARTYQAGIGAIQDALRPFVRRANRPRTRDEAAAALRVFAAEQLAELDGEASNGDDTANGLKRAYDEHLEPVLAVEKRGEAQLACIRPFNLAAVALYLAHLTEEADLTPLTIAAYRTDLTTALRLFPRAALTELDEAAMEVLLALDQAAATKRRTRGTLRRLRRFLGDRLDLSLPSLELERWPGTNVTQGVHLLSLQDVERLLDFLARRGSARDRSAYLGVLLAFEAGLRASEVAALCLQDLVMRGGRFVEVREGKFDKSRRVSLAGASPATLSALDRVRRQRWRESGSDPLAPLTPDAEGDPLSSGALSRHVVEAMAALDMRGDPATGSPVTFHRLRHGAVCRRLLRGQSPPQVAHWVGHAAPGVTTQTYAHHWDWAQRACLRQYDDPRLPEAPHLTPVTVGVLMDLTPQAVKAALERASSPERPLRRVPVSQVPGTVWGVRKQGGSEAKVIPLEDALRLMVSELENAKG